MSPQPVVLQQSIRFGEDFELDLVPRRLRRGTHVLKLERIPLEILILLLEHPREIVSREEIVARVWGEGVFLDTDNSIRGAIRKVRQALKDDADTPRFIETITGQGYRFVAPVMDQTAEKPAHVEQAERKVDHSRRLARQWLIVGTVCLLAVIAVLTYALSRPRIDAGASKVRSLAVLPLKNLSGDPTQEYLADGMTEEIIGRLASIRELRVVSRTSVMGFKDTKLTVPEVAKELNVDAIVEGSVIRDRDRIRVHAQLIRAATDAHFWSETYDREFKDVLSLESDVAQSVAQKIQVTITGPERDRLASVVPIAPEVYEKYLKGRWAFQNSKSKADVDNSIVFFQQAIAENPSFAPAYLGLADAYDGLGTIFIGAPPEEMRRKAMDAANKALQLDPQSVGAHIFMAGMYGVQWQWKQSEDEVRRALELNPNSPAAHDGMVFWLTCQGRTDEALTWARRARELDPGRVPGTLFWILFVSHRYPEAIRELRSALALRRDEPDLLWNLGYNLIANGQPEEAIPPLEKALAISDRSPGVIGVLIRAYAHAGRRPAAFRLLAELKQRQQSGYVPAGAFVNAYLGLGDTDQAFAALEQGYKEHSNILQFLKVHPHFDPIRNDPRFRDLIHRVGLD